MDIEFIVQDTFSLTRPQWKLATTFDEAAKAFQLAVAQDQKNAGLDKSIDQDDASSGASSDDDGGDGDGDIVLPEADGDDDSELGEDDAEVWILDSTLYPHWRRFTNHPCIGQDIENQPQSPDFESEEEAIVVTRKAEEVDPEDEADFEREYAKMMAESLESRKFDRKPLFDVPLPVRPKTRDVSSTTDTDNANGDSAPSTMAFSLLTKKGNRQQVCLNQ